jgi:hypothetical protein
VGRFQDILREDREEKRKLVEEFRNGKVCLEREV